MTQRSWYVVQCKAKESFRAAENLENQGYQVFHPCLEVERRRQGKLRLITEPLFPYYLFIYLSEDDNWRPLRSTRGVLRLVSFGQQPVKMNTQLIEALQNRVARPPENYLEAGDPVLIEEGPFKGLSAIFQSKKGEDRALLLLELLQKQQTLDLPIAEIRPL